LFVCNNHTKHTSALCEQNVPFVIRQQMVHI